MSENEALKMALESWANDLEQGRQVWIPATTLRKAASALAQPEQKPLAKVEPCAVCGEGKARLSVIRSCDTCHSEYAGQAEMKVALAQPEQEPVGYTDPHGTAYAIKWSGKLPQNLTLYTTSPQRSWVGLTDEWVESAGARWVRDGYDLYTYARAIEAKLKEKNT